MVECHPGDVARAEASHLEQLSRGPFDCCPPARSVGCQRGCFGSLYGHRGCPRGEELLGWHVGHQPPPADHDEVVGVLGTSDIRWEETNTVRPWSARDRSRWRTHMTPSGSRPLIGSSSITTGGSPSSARAMPSR